MTKIVTLLLKIVPEIEFLILFLYLEDKTCDWKDKLFKYFNRTRA